MISKKENLLVRPWQQRRYENHRRKVQSAAPAIDTKPPVSRQHVTLKLKQKQKENERCEQIERNNFNLLKRMSYIMRTSRVDNYWKTPQPNFLNRVSMYDIRTPNFQDLYIDDSPSPSESRTGRKAKCLACTPQKIQETVIPEERVPWEPCKPPVSRERSKSVPIVKSREFRREVVKEPSSANCQKAAKQTKLPFKNNISTKVHAEVYAKEPQSIVLSRGCLKLAVNFPSDTIVKFQKGNQEKILMKNICNCKNIVVPV